MASCMTRGDSELKGMRGTLRQQAERLDRVEDALESKADLYDDLRHSLKDMSSELADIKAGAGRLKAMQNIQKATTAVLNLAQTFDTLDVNSSGSIDIGELRRGLHMLGMDSHSAQANMIIQRYTHDQVIDIKTFTTLVRDIHLLLTFDQDGSGTLDAEELKPALEKLGLHCSDESLVKIIRAWDADDSGKLDLLEFTDLVRSLTTFAKYDKDGSGDIDVAELRPALRRLGLQADTATANAVLRWYDGDNSGKIELYEFAVLARDVSVFTAFDKDHSGLLDASELHPALAKLGLSTSESEVRRIIDVWDDHKEGAINLLEFSEIVRDLQVFEQFDVDRSGSISTAELRIALGKLGVHLSHPQTQDLLGKYDDDDSGQIEFPEFRKLAEDLPSLVGREKDSFFRMHHTDSAYVHAEDLLDAELHPDLVDPSFAFDSESVKKRPMEERGQASVLASSGQTVSILGAADGVLPSPASNPFNSRLLSSEYANVRAANLKNHQRAPLHQSRSMVRD